MWASVDQQARVYLLCLVVVVFIPHRLYFHAFWLLSFSLSSLHVSASSTYLSMFFCYVLGKSFKFSCECICPILLITCGSDILLVPVPQFGKSSPILILILSILPPPVPSTHHSHHPSPLYSFIPGLKPSFSANHSHYSLPCLPPDWLDGFPGLFTNTSEHIRFYFSVFLFSTFYFFVPCGRWSWLVTFWAYVKIASRIASYSCKQQIHWTKHITNQTWPFVTLLWHHLWGGM